MAGSVNTFCIKGIIKLIIVLAIIIILLIVGTSYLVNFLTLEKLGMGDKKVFNDMTFKELALADRSLIEVYKETKPMLRYKDYMNLYDASVAKSVFEENGINQALIENAGGIDYTYIFNNDLMFKETKTISLADKEIIYLYRECLSKLDLFESKNLKDTLIGVEIIKAGGKAFLRLVFDWSFYLNELDFDIKLLRPKKLYFGFYYSLNILDGKLNAELRSASINGVSGGLAEGIINALFEEKTLNDYQTILKTVVTAPLNHLGKVGILVNTVPQYGIIGVENGKIQLITHKE